MFKKLKEKITEEVKSSPQRLQQLTQSVSDRLQNSTTSDENFFSIGDDDANMSNASIDPLPGFSNVTLTSTPQEGGRYRRNSNSSVASDMSFLPRYESSGSMYHLQSDLDVSASEVEDNASTSSQLGHLSKEQIYSAFEKAQTRYHKYRGRYTDLARHYKDLERENSKMKMVLVETQDKAIRRVTELKEQCVLEQKAKAHLESALRDELDEKQLKIDSLQTKIGLLKHNGNGGSNLLDIDGDNLETLAKYLNDARKEIENLNEKLQESKENSIIFQSKETEYKIKISRLEKEIGELIEREKENNLLLAQSKMELHNEIINKDSELMNLKHDNEVLKQSLETFEIKGGSKLENLQSQNLKLIEKIENLTQKCNNYEMELLKMEQLKIEKEKLHEIVKNNAIEIESVRNEMKQSLAGLEARIQEKYQCEFDEKQTKLKKQFDEEIQQLSSNNDDFNDFKIKVVDTENLLKQLNERNERIQNEYQGQLKKYDELESNHLELIDECSKLRNEISKLEDDLMATEKKQETIITLENTIKTLQKEKQLLFDEYKQKDGEKSKLDSIICEHKNEIEKLNKEQHKNQTELSKLVHEKSELFTTIQDNSTEILRLEEFVAELKEKLRLIDNEKVHLLSTLELNENELNVIGDEKEELKQQVDQLRETVRIYEEKQVAVDLDNTETKLLEMKLQRMEEEQRKLLENFENERKVMIDDNLKLINSENMIEQLRNELEKIKNDFDHKNQSFNQQQNELDFLQRDRQKLNDYCTDLNEKIRLYEERVEANELNITESRLIEIKLQQVEHDKDELIKNFDNERKMFEEIIKNESTENKWKLKSYEDKLNELQFKLHDYEDILNEKQKLEFISKTNDEDMSILKQNCELKDDEISKLKTMINELENVKIKYEMELKIVDEINNSKNILEDNIELFKRELSEKQKEIDDLRRHDEELKLLHLKIVELSDIYKFNNDNNIENILDNLRSIGEKYAVILDENNNLKNQVSRVENLEIDLQTEKQQNQQFKLVLEQFEINKSNQINYTKKLEENLLKLETDLETITNENRILNEQVIEFEKCDIEIKRLKNDYDILKNEKNQLENELKEQIKQQQIIDVKLQDLEEVKRNLLHEIEEKQKILLETNSEKYSLQNSVHQLQEMEKIVKELNATNEELNKQREKFKDNISQLELRNNHISTDNNYLSEQNQNLSTELEELKLILNERIVDEASKESNDLQMKYNELFIESKELKTNLIDLEKRCEELMKFESQLNELEHQYGEIMHEKQLLKDEVQELKISPINNVQNNDTNLLEYDRLREKLTKYKSLDLTNRTSIEFYENELEKLKNHNDKLNRKLDETLVTLNHCAELSNSTEIEYLRNVLYNYMLGKESLILTRVIAAVCKFTPQQTETVLQKEQQKQTLLGQLGIL